MRTSLLTIAALALASPSLRAQGTAQEYEESCERGDLVDCSVMGLIYQTGAGGTRDLERAMDLYERACAREVVAACKRIDLLRDESRPEQPDNDRVRVGYVADGYDGAPLGGAIVRVRGIAGIGERRYLSDQEGRVVLDPLPYGTHKIDVQRGGYSGTEGNLPVPWDGDFLILLDKVLVEEEARTTGQVFGQVVDEGSGVGVSDVDVVLRGGATSRTISNGEGRFLLSDLPPGEFELRFERIGYQPRTTALTVERGRTVEVLATLSAQPVELEPVQVSVASAYLARSGFYRRALVPGEQLTFRDIERLAPMSLADLLRRIPGITVVAPAAGPGVEAISNRRSGGAPLGRCRLQPYYNGTPMVGFDLDILRPEDLEALEVYQGSNVPIEYLDPRQIDGPSCGVILLWTRDPQRARGR